jgi:hypothetical protein
MNKNLQIVLSLSLLSILACEPVIAIGKNELLCILVLFLALIGPPLYRFFRRLDDFLKHEKKDK